MARLNFVETLLDGPLSYVSGITDLDIYAVNGVARLYTTTGDGGGVTVRDIDSGMAIISSRAHSVAQSLTAPIQTQRLMVNEVDTLAVFGQPDNGLSGYSLSNDGQLLQNVSVSAEANTFASLEVVSVGSNTLIFTSDQTVSGLTCWEITSAGKLRMVEEFARGIDASGTDIPALSQITVKGATFLLAASGFENNLKSYEISTNGTVSQSAMLDAASGLWVNMPNVLATAEIAGVSYILLGAAGSSSISVMEINNNGVMVVIDHVLDSLETRFQNITVLEVVTVEDRVFVLAGGADDGLSLMTLLPGGRLLHLDTIEDSLSSALTNVSALAVAIVGDAIEVFAAGGSEAGISRLALETGVIAAGQIGTNAAQTHNGTGSDDLLSGLGGDDTLQGNGGDDILMDGSGLDHLYGGLGADIFVMEIDGLRDVIHDFQLGIDRIDLSGFSMLYTAAQMTISSTNYGAVVSFDGEELEIRTMNGASLAVAALTRANLLDLNHSTIFRQTSIVGDGDDNSLIGTDEDNVIRGEGGDDTLRGEGGDDSIEGGVGADRLEGGDGDDTLDGGDGVDILIGNNGNDILRGALGNDQLVGSAGHDHLEGGAGNDHLEGGADNDTLRGGNGDDTLLGGSGEDHFWGGDGHDLFILSDDGETDFIHDFDILTDQISLGAWAGLTLSELAFTGLPDGVVIRFGNEVLRIYSANGAAMDASSFNSGGLVFDVIVAPPPGDINGTNGEDELVGTAGDDEIHALGGFDTVFGLAGKDQIYGDAGRDTLYGGEGNDTLYGGTWADELNGENGNDMLYGGDADDLLLGNAGNDQLYGGSGRDTLEGGAGADALDGGYWADTLLGGLGNDTLDGGYGDDSIEGNDGDDLILGNGGNDRLYGNSGKDTLLGDTGSDHLYGGNDDDLLNGETWSDQLFGEGGNDTLIGGQGDDLLDGGAGDDRLEGGIGRDRLYGGDGDDLLIAGTWSDQLYGGNGADTLDGGDGNDHLEGGSGNDLLQGGNGADRIYGQAGNDRLEGGEERDRLEGGDGNDTLYGGTWSDLIFGDDGDDFLFGEHGNDGLSGGFGNDHLEGGAGRDKLYGGGGNDFLDGGSWSDELYGGFGNDRLEGGGGGDTMTGGGGNDTFVFNKGNDVITDFDANFDTLLFAIDLWSGQTLGLSALQAASTFVDGDTIINFDSSTSLTLENFSDLIGLSLVVDFV
ncbi:MAG: calcium-binding protein [Rhodobacteraceae bacterium]|nr:calcium-binding protein [Paracoccaceae bacterium]